MAEKQTTSYAYAFTLTYADIDGEPPLGAKVFRYKDVSDMFKRIRRAGQRKWGERIDFRYVVVGERGSKYGRCHYHGVMFSSHPVVELGKLSGAKSNEFAYKRRLNWSIWGHGYVEFQPADRKGMAYVLKYILKSRMTAERSKGFGREGKTEWLASSYLWCSKRPAVGATWLWDKINYLVSNGLAPPALRMRVSGGGDWYVHGKLQMEMCLFLHQANNEHRAKTGNNLAGWSTLLASVEEEIELVDTGEIVKRKPWEWLTNGEETEYEGQETDAEQGFQRFKANYEARRKLVGAVYSARATVEHCGHIVPCDACKAQLSPADRADLEQERLLRFEQWGETEKRGRKESAEQYEARFDRWWLTRLRPSRGCGSRESDFIQEQFRKLVPITKAQPRLKARAAVGGALQRETG